jgi:hypothetical protein
MEKVLTIYEGDCTGRGRGGYDHETAPKIITPPKALRRVGQGANSIALVSIIKYPISYVLVKLDSKAGNRAFPLHRIITDL